MDNTETRLARLEELTHSMFWRNATLFILNVLTCLLLGLGLVWALGFRKMPMEVRLLKEQMRYIQSDPVGGYVPRSEHARLDAITNQQRLQTNSWVAMNTFDIEELRRAQKMRPRSPREQRQRLANPLYNKHILGIVNLLNDTCSCDSVGRPVGSGCADLNCGLRGPQPPPRR